MKLETLDDVALLLSQVNSITKYPSIPTYHKIGERGVLSPVIQTPHNGQELWGTEKVDGTNSRIISLPNGLGWIIGSREELLWYSGDMIPNPQMGIVAATRRLMTQVVCPHDGSMTVVYLETYGGNIGQNAKQYTKDREGFGCRVFDVAVFTAAEIEELPVDLDRISFWREHVAKPFLNYAKMIEQCIAWNLPIVPAIGLPGPIPAGLEDTHNWLKAAIPESRCKLDGTAAGKPEGLVVRTTDRSIIAKLRFEDYERTMRVLNQSRPATAKV